MVAEELAYLNYLRDVLGVNFIPLNEKGTTTMASPNAQTTRTVDSPAKSSSIQGPANKKPSAQIETSSLESLKVGLEGCTRCKLSKGRNQIVFGAGNPKARLMFVGEGPGEEEDKQGVPFVGRAGQLLTKMIEAMGLSRQDVFIANVVKCRPPNNRNPEPDEIESCSPFLAAQLDLIKPKVVVALGTFAAQTLLKSEEKISKLRGRFIDRGSHKLMPTFHPAYLLRNPSAKKEAWEDLQTVMKELGITAPPKKDSKI